MVELIKTQINRNVAQDRLQRFHLEMIKEYARHYPEKGDSWKTCELKWLTDLFQRASLEFMDDADVGIKNPDQLIDIANICAFIWMRVSADNGEERKP